MEPTETEDAFAPLSSFQDEWPDVIDRAEPPPEGVTIHQRIVWLQGLIGGVGKGGYQTQDGYNFRRIDDVMNSIHVPLCKAGLYIQPVEVDVRTEPWTVWKNFNREFWVVMDYVITAIDGQQVTIRATGNAINSGDKGVAAAKSYAYKQMISQLLSLPTDDPAMDVEHENHDTRRQEWWEAAGWVSADAHDVVRGELMKRLRALPAVEAAAWKEWAARQDTGISGPLYSKSHQRVANQIPFVLSGAWSEAIDDQEAAAAQRLAAEAPFESAEQGSLVKTAPVTEDAAAKAEAIVTQIAAEEIAAEENAAEALALLKGEPASTSKSGDKS
jgi:hypothetical protein